jgi:hypothetical protein
MASRVGRGVALPFLDRGIRSGWVVNSTPQLHFTPPERPGTHCTGGWVGPRASLDSGKSRPTGIRSPDCPARSQSLYRLSYLALVWCAGWNELIHLVVCLTTGPKPLPNRALHIVRSRASNFKCEYPLLSLRSSSSFLRFLPRLPVTSISPFIFPWIIRCRRQFLHKMWPIQEWIQNNKMPSVV